MKKRYYPLWRVRKDKRNLQGTSASTTTGTSREGNLRKRGVYFGKSHSIFRAGLPPLVCRSLLVDLTRELQRFIVTLMDPAQQRSRKRNVGEHRLQRQGQEILFGRRF